MAFDCVQFFCGVQNVDDAVEGLALTLFDEAGIAVGGIRTPQVDAPIATLSGLGQAGGSFCMLFGTTTPLTSEELASRYPSPEAFLEEWTLSLDGALAAGTILPEDAAMLQVVAETYSFGR